MATPGTIAATRLLDEPIIYPNMDERMGGNINGAAIVRVPDWIDGPLGTYYLYFSDHKGLYIRMAYADALTGPWRMYTPGVLDLQQSLFEVEDPPEPPASERPEWAKKMQGGYLYAHIASPDVHIDHQQKRMVMYFHGLLRNGDQQTRHATSRNGLTFTASRPLLGPPYFRAFTYDGFVYALTWGGEIWRAADWHGPFERGPQLVPYAAKEGIGEGFRHGEVHRKKMRLYILYTRMGDRPERILYGCVDLSAPWSHWKMSKPAELLRPERKWEGADLPLATSTMGAVQEPVRELRDPCVFKDTDGSTYLLYCGAGEQGIGIATLTFHD